MEYLSQCAFDENISGIVLDDSTPSPSKEGHRPKNPRVLLSTTAGDITVELYSSKAPETVKNFLQYVTDGHYAGTIFHRVIDNFMIQGGGFSKEMAQKSTRSPIKNEANNGLKNDKGSVAMARTSSVDSATAQFFINIADNDFLNYQGENARDYGYCVFGAVVAGIDIIDAISLVKTGSVGGHRDVPLEPIVILNARILTPPSSP